MDMVFRIHFHSGTNEMVQSFSQVWLHLVFSTKDRSPFLQKPEFRNEMFRMLGHQVKEAGCEFVRSGGWIDHVHIACGLSRTITIAKLIEHVKVETSKWAKTTTYAVKTFGWQNGYGAFSVSQSNLDQVVDYIERQEEHHRRMTFQEEFRAICRKHGIVLDEKHAWD
jgi:putative transposase